MLDLEFIIIFQKSSSSVCRLSESSSFLMVGLDFLMTGGEGSMTGLDFLIRGAGSGFEWIAYGNF